MPPGLLQQRTQAAVRIQRCNARNAKAWVEYFMRAGLNLSQQLMFDFMCTSAGLCGGVRRGSAWPACGLRRW